MDVGTKYMYQRSPKDRPPMAQRPDSNGGNNGNGGPQRPSGSRLIVRTLIILGLLLLGWYLIQFFTQGSNNSNPNAVEIPYSTFYQEVTAGNVKDVAFSGQDANGEFKTPQTVVDVNGQSKASATSFHFTLLPNGDTSLTTLLNSHGVSYSAKPGSDNSVILSILFTWVPWILLIVFFFFIFRRANQGQQNIFSFGKSKAKVIMEDRP